MTRRSTIASFLFFAVLALLGGCARAPAPAEPAPVSPPSRAATSGPPRVAILNFGLPSATVLVRPGGQAGTQITAAAWRDAIPLLEADNVDVVIIRVNASDVLPSEVESFHRVLGEYKKRWRTAVWVESAIGAACMAAWVIPEWYFLPEGNAGACAMHNNLMQAMRNPDLAAWMAVMDAASRAGDHDPKIMRSMQILEPLSCNIDENNSVTWFQNLSGKYTVNGVGRILVFNAVDAQKYHFSKGTAATPDELAEIMGLKNAVWAGGAAANLIDDRMAADRQTPQRR